MFVNEKNERLAVICLAILTAIVLFCSTLIGTSSVLSDVWSVAPPAVAEDLADIDAGSQALASSRAVVINTAAIATDTTWTAREWGSGDWTTAEIWYSIDQGTTNTMTLYLDVSPDNSIWKTGQTTIVSANVADATSYTSATIAGTYYRIRADVTNSNSITPTIKIVFR